MKTKFKRWFEKQHPTLWGFEKPIYTTYAERGLRPVECKNPGVKPSDFWWPNTFAAYAGFVAGSGK